MLVKAKSLVGKTYEIPGIEPDESIVALKTRILDQILAKESASTESERFFNIRLVHKGKTLADSTNIGESGVNDGDFVVVIPSRKMQPPEPESTPIPTAQSILAATQMNTSGSDTNLSASGERATDPQQLQAQLQDLLATLVGFSTVEGASEQRDRAAVVAAAAALAAASSGNLNQAPPRTNSTSDASNAPATLEVDPGAVQQLTDMGFAEEHAKKALLLNRLNTELAMEWLLEHSEDPDIDQPISEEQMRQLAQAEANFAPDAGSVQKLQEMGFALEDINAALRATGNNYEAACAWLLGDRDVSMDQQETETNPVISAILNNQAVLAGLRNPRVLQAFQAMIANPAAGQQYVNDPEIGPILCEVHRIIRNVDSQ
eukprot:TRINITY_DN9995_c0_g1_i2.p1 TRINITY_DN9995_c0_g1~~TRINITY_DN9995_c0_g1_i2.p1  ORF type:complete len:375 (-),score=84.91 TRINITY_DN9995_c0_g1_i2:28-1152(-)